MNQSYLEQLIQSVYKILSKYDCYDVYFLDSNGKWQQDPQTTREIISSEFWFRIRLLSQAPSGDSQVRVFFEPLITNPYFPKLIKKFKNGNEFNATIEILYHFIEYEAYRLIISKYIPEWDYKEKKIQKEFIQKAEDFKKHLAKLLPEPELSESFFHLIAEYENSTFFKMISKIVAEEIRLNEEKIFIKEKLKENSKTAFIYENLNINFVPDTGISITEPGALVRPLVKKLKEGISLSLGEQYEIISLLGALKDTRCARTLFHILNKTKFENANLLSAIIYALGNVGYKGMVEKLKEILDMPDYIEISSSNHKQSLYEIKGEVIWALGKLGIEGRTAIDGMIKLRNHKDNSVKIALAWALGMIGEKEKNIEGTLDPEILTTLIEFLNERDKKIFEEALYSLKKINFYEIIERLNLHNIPATPILSLKPSSIGLYELSETIYHLMSLKQPVIMAVTGDSGTGKTYFCEAIKNGFGDITKDDILYLMRDNPAHRTIFSKIIDPELVKGFLDPQYYTMETMDERKLTPSEAFANFIKQNTHKKLIILDGWLDDIYFYQVLKAFYLNNSLDCIVNFRTTYSTRRINLETREGILERVRDCLRFVENPAIEETEFYRNGDVFVYNLDNSIGSRVSNEEIKEVFSRKKVGQWADYIRIGRFEKEAEEILIKKESLKSKNESFTVKIDNKITVAERQVDIQTEHFSRIINDNLSEKPNLLQTVKLERTAPTTISHYSPGMIAYSNENGIVGILAGMNNQNFYTRVEFNKVSKHCHYNELLCLAHSSSIKTIDFNKDKALIFTIPAPLITAISSDRNKNFATGHSDGTIRLWDFKNKNTALLLGHKFPIIGLFITKEGIIISSSKDGELRLWNFKDGTVKIYNDLRFATEHISVFQFSNKIILLKDETFIILDHDMDCMELIKINGIDIVTAFYPYYDGRIFIGLVKDNRYGLAVLEDKTYKIIGFQERRIESILIMGPRIITAGRAGLDIWGTEGYVQAEIEKLKILKESKKPFYYHSMIF